LRLPIPVAIVRDVSMTLADGGWTLWDNLEDLLRQAVAG
jgi:hypothetical protein